jgi:dTDP-4-dehydrorhamnose reductase
MKVLLTGAAGQLGRHLRATAPVSVSLVTSSRRGADQPCDLTDFNAVSEMLDRIRPEAVINAGAWTAVDAAEDEPEAAHRLNAELPGLLARWCGDHDAKLVTYSTDYVFSGQPNRPWLESDPTAPQSVYGRSKLAGEQAVMKAQASALIVRTAWVYSALPGNFLSAILARAARGEDLRVVADQVGSPTWAGSLARASWTLLGSMDSGSGRSEIVHVAGRGAMSWHEFAGLAVNRAAAIGLIPGPVSVAPINSDQWPQKATRPAWSVLDCSRYADLTGEPLMEVESALAECLNQWNQAPC